ncbi:4-hydroxybenzoyl-CoA thioesterase [Marinobacterium nitratireducens]|uniref:4-hydroxybenzoyl-CoA thioesterase n=1 Tax=Marinobacterium nitratireducens TaxID=518897 RepID=A0A917ZIZ5_9GAMM|nr:acyl-CoA thioesterase [Marinobacterium nitratireducens]GGO83841.1 4-hydroxybenzoyl-CoA thioesterase [Marinobacterium nitratireducens]
MLKRSRRLEVEWGDCDPAGIVYFPRYFEYFNTSTERMFAFDGMKKIDLLQRYDAVGFPMVETQSKFFEPSQYGDRIRIDSEIVKIGRSSFAVLHRIFNETGELTVECTENRVWTGKDHDGKIRSMPLPADIVAHLESDRLITESFD